MHNVLGKKEGLILDYHYKIHDEIIIQEIKELAVDVTIGGYYATLMRYFLYDCKNIFTIG